MNYPSEIDYGPKTHSKDQRITVCKRCRYGIFRGQEYTWQTRPAPGFVHTDCLP